MTLYIEKENSSFLKLETPDESIIRHIRDEFKFDVLGYRFTNAYKKGKGWNGQIYLLKKNKFLYSGLIDVLEDFLKKNNYAYKDNFRSKEKDLISLEEMRNHVSSLALPFEVRDYQIKSSQILLNKKNSICVSPTSCMDENTEIEVELTKEALDFILFNRKIKKSD